MTATVGESSSGRVALHMYDSGVGSFGSESDSSPIGPAHSNPTAVYGAGAFPGSVQAVPFGAEMAFAAVYFGEAVLDRRHTPAMLPWVMADVRRRGEGRGVVLEVSAGTLRVTVGPPAHQVALFEHKLQSMTRFARTRHDPKFFSYLMRSNPESPFSCHVFLATDETMVQSLFDAVRHVMSDANREGGAGEMLCNTTHLYEVLYIGKVVVSTKKAPPTFIDDAVLKFDEYAKQQQNEVVQEMTGKRRQRLESDASIQSLPADLERVVSIRENELGCQTKSKVAADGTSCDGTLSSGSDDAFVICDANCTATPDLRITTEDSSDTECEIACTSHESLYDAICTETQKLVGTDLPKSLASGQSLQRLAVQQRARAASESTEQRNRTMLIQVGQNELALISLDRKSVIFERQFKDISFCSQGISHPEHFGFISRDPDSGNFTCYVFRCASESVVDEVMLTLKHAFQSAFQQNTSKNLIVCELCPMHQLHKLCQQIDKMTAEQVQETLLQRIQQLNEQDQTEIKLKACTSSNCSMQECNELMMSALLRLSETKQQDHVHLGDVGRSSHGKYDGRTTKADQRMNSETCAAGGPGILRGGLLAADSRMKMADGDAGWIDPRLRRHSVPYGTTLSRSSPLHEGIEERGHTTQGRTDSSSSSGNNGIPRDSPLRSMFAKVGNGGRGAVGAGPPSRCPRVKYRDGEPRRTPPAGQVHGRSSFRLGILSSVTGATVPGLVETGSNFGRSLANLKAPVPGKKMRMLWQKAILETMLLIQMNKENKSYEVTSPDNTHHYVGNASSPEMVLDYDEITPCLKEVTKVWEQMITTPNRCMTKFDLSDLSRAIQDGVPRARRGEIWLLLMEQYRLHHGSSALPENVSGEEYHDLLKRLTLHQHAILIDLGRTFPTHPYFSTQLGPGQLSLFNLLKAYSLLDEEVGYCQGLSFIAGILLMHVSEQKAFDVMKYMMFELGFRRQYRPDMVSLQIQMYQLSRLLHDYHKDLYDHFELNEIAPTLYAAPWFLTIFASQFPLGFVARVFDLIFLHGMEVVLKVGLALLGNHKELIKQCSGFESIVEFLKSTLPEMGIIQLERVINQVLAMDISKQLEAYEVEYHILQEEMSSLHADSAPKSHQGSLAGMADADETAERLLRLQVTNDALRRQKTELLEQLQIARRQNHALEEQNQVLVSNERKLQSHVQALELERTALLSAVTALRNKIDPDVFRGAIAGILPAGVSELEIARELHSSNDVDHEVAELTAVRRSESEVVDLGAPKLCQVVKGSRVLQLQQERPASTNY